jgi:hypothetical protein
MWKLFFARVISAGPAAGNDTIIVIRRAGNACTAALRDRAGNEVGDPRCRDRRRGDSPPFSVVAEVDCEDLGGAVGAQPGARKRLTHRRRVRCFRALSGLIRGTSRCSIGLGKAIALIGHRESSIGFRRNLDPIRRPVVCRRRREVHARRRRRHGLDRDGGHWLIDAIGDENSRHSVFLSAQE